VVRILERIGQQIRALGVPDKQQWASVGAVSTAWSRLDPVLKD
jgi:hypothetical protein